MRCAQMGVRMIKICVKITTRSNLMIGGIPTGFDIGGVDTCTVLDFGKKPFIPASSFKGALRRIVKELEAEGEEDAVEIAEQYRKYLQHLQSLNEMRLQNEKAEKFEEERITAMQKRFKKSINEASAEYLFGIQGFNTAPKLIFNDLIIPPDFKEKDLFSVDTKNSIYCVDDEIQANPRTYQTVRPGIIFEGDILFYHLEELKAECVKRFVKKAIEEFNSGIYRLGNSGSRGYGRIQVEVV